MAQGKFKVKSQLPAGVKNKRGQRHKAHRQKKGGAVIAPKKTKLIEAEKLKKGLQKAIKCNIEQEVKMLAKSVEPKAFHVLGFGQTGQGTSKSTT